METFFGYHQYFKRQMYTILGFLKNILIAFRDSKLVFTRQQLCCYYYKFYRYPYSVGNCKQLFCSFLCFGDAKTTDAILLSALSTSFFGLLSSSWSFVLASSKRMQNEARTHRRQVAAHSTSLNAQRYKCGQEQ